MKWFHVCWVLINFLSKFCQLISEKYVEKTTPSQFELCAFFKINIRPLFAYWGMVCKIRGVYNRTPPCKFSENLIMKMQKHPRIGDPLLGIFYNIITPYPYFFGKNIPPLILSSCVTMIRPTATLIPRGTNFFKKKKHLTETIIPTKCQWSLKTLTLWVLFAHQFWGNARRKKMG